MTQSPDEIRQQIAEAQKAQDLLNEPIVKSFIEDYYKKIFEEWQKTPEDDIKGREWLYMKSRCLEEFILHFKRYIARGITANEQIEMAGKGYGIF